MKKEKSNAAEQPSEYIKSQKESFRVYQRNLPFGEKMEIAFSLAERDKTIQQAVLLPKISKAINK
jgi:hypothetical protein